MKVIIIGFLLLITILDNFNSNDYLILNSDTVTLEIEFNYLED